VQTGVPDNGVRIGILGGTFDPIHVGHLAIAAAVSDALSLDSVLFVVANQPWQKLLHGEVTAAADRYAMVEAALADEPGFVASDIEIRRGGDSFTADTVAEVAAANPDGELFVIIGADLVPQLVTWERPDEIRVGASLAILPRPGSGPGSTVDPPPGWSAIQIPSAPVELSSSDLRHAMAEGRSVRFLIPPAALEVIDERGLYRSSLGGS
jgi:nicotinate-nucleotide adenylyltransferase